LRRQRACGLEAEAQAEGPNRSAERSKLRRAQWSTYYHRFFGRIRPGDRVSPDFAPPSLDEATLLLNETVLRGEKARGEAHVRRPYLTRRCVSQMLLYGYRPVEEREKQFNELATRAARPTVVPAGAVDADARAKDFLVHWGEREFGAKPLSPEQVVQEMQVPGGGRMISLPTRLQHVQGAFEVEKDVYLRTDLASVSALVNPENWERMGEFFAETYREGRRPGRKADAPARSWQGVLQEDFIVTWNSFTINIFKQRLKIDYSVTKQTVRADYALMFGKTIRSPPTKGSWSCRRDRSPAGYTGG
jgi:hypothetical protein